MCNILICGTYDKIRACDPGEGFTKPLENVICPFCYHKGDTIYRQSIKKFTFCFIPLCTLTKSEPMLSCFSCSRAFGYSGVKYCARCRTISPNGYNFCTNCGVKTEYQTTQYE